MDLEFHDVTYRYPGTERDALSGIDLSVQTGEFVGLIGLNGAGKTTLCRLCAGFAPHFYHGILDGQVCVRGVDTRDSSIAQVAQHLGYVFQEAAQQFSGTAATVYEEVAFGPENLGLDRAATRQRVDDALGALGIADLADRSPWEISGGQQQRVALASVLAMQPSILVLDEPTAQLDPLGTRDVFAAIRQLWRKGMTVVMVEHKLDPLIEVATRLVYLVDGQLAADGSPGAVLASEAFANRGMEPPTVVQIGRRLGLQPLPLTFEDAVAVLHV
jgi:energy-coupling factor transporter ATP-binding protein EcfA2